MAPRAPRGRRVYKGRHVTVHYEPNKKSIARCAVGPELFSAVYQVAATKAKPYAISISPRSNRMDKRHYQDSFFIEMVRTGLAAPETIGRPPMLRVGARLWNLAAHAAAVEWGKKGHKGHRVLGRTLDHLNGAARDG